MDNLLTLALEAHNNELNHHRRYEFSVGRDLFDEWTLVVRYGRVGRGGQEQRFAAKEGSEIKRLIREKLNRRLTSAKRIGCKYRIVDLDTQKSGSVDSLLPLDLLANFYQKTG